MAPYPVTPTRNPKGKPGPGKVEASKGPQTPRSTPARADSEENTTDLRPRIARLMNAETVVCMVEDFIGYYFPEKNTEILYSVLEYLKEHYPDILVPRQGSEETSALDGEEENSAGEEDDGYLSDEEENADSGATKQPKLYSHVLKDFDEPPSVKKKRGKANVNEVKLFDPMAAIGEAIRNALATILGVTLNEYHIRMCPHSSLESDIDGCNQRIDGAATKNMDEVDGKLRVTDIVVPFEFKVRRTKKSVLANREQVASHVNHTMNDDPRRKFMFAITIEDDRVSLWFFSRSHSVKTRSFSIVERPELYIQILISLFCATDEQLGFDPLVTLAQGKRYVYEFPPAGVNQGESTFYITIQSIEEYRSLRLRGRSTRIWKVLQVRGPNDLRAVGDKPKPMILKDISMDTDTPTEADIQEELFSDLDNLQKDDAWRKCEILRDYSKDDLNSLADAFNGGYRRFFSCIKEKHIGEPGHLVCPKAWTIPEVFPRPKEGDSKAAAPVTTRSHMIDERSEGILGSVKVQEEAINYEALLAEEVNAAGLQEANNVTVEVPNILVDTTEVEPVLEELNPRRQCRYLYETVCTPLQDIPLLGPAVDILRQALIGLQLMFCAGWVHRDISAGNILAFKETPTSPWRAKLSDLEYAKRFPSSNVASRIPKTGTPFFMACETLSKSLLLSDDLSDEGAQDSDDDNQDTPRAPAIHSYQHDLESIWWILVWLVGARARQCLKTEFGEHYFQNRIDVGHAQARLVLFTTHLHLDYLLPTSIPPLLHRSKFMKRLNSLRKDLLRQYLARNKNGDLNTLATYSFISGKAFAHFFEGIKDSRRDWGAIPLLVQREIRRQQAELRTKKLELEKKRKASDGEEPEGLNDQGSSNCGTAAANQDGEVDRVHKKARASDT
ncbi:other/FunK1 protein kinase [Coprinopsis cinerea AmutBmut pab1-1]|nr:other/FunK1 protein kinase [Coprinopsis cinerea AmutBmut pab1-1]